MVDGGNVAFEVAPRRIVVGKMMPCSFLVALFPLLVTRASGGSSAAAHLGSHSAGLGGSMRSLLGVRLGGHHVAKGGGASVLDIHVAVPEKDPATEQGGDLSTVSKQAAAAVDAAEKAVADAAAKKAAAEAAAAASAKAAAEAAARAAGSASAPASATPTQQPTLAPPAVATAAAGANNSAINTTAITNELGGFQIEVVKLENAITNMRSHMLMAEQLVMSFSKNVTTARDKLFSTRKMARANMYRLKDTMRNAANLNASLDLAGFKGNAVQPALNQVLADSGNASSLVEKTTTDGNIAKLQTITDKLWKVTDPNDPDSIDKTEQRVMWMQGNLTVFQKFLSNRTRAMLVKRLRRGGNKIRRALRKLGNVQTGHEEGGDGDEALLRLAKSAKGPALR